MIKNFLQFRRRIGVFAPVFPFHSRLAVLRKAISYRWTGKYQFAHREVRCTGVRGFPRSNAEVSEDVLDRVADSRQPYVNLSEGSS